MFVNYNFEGIREEWNIWLGEIFARARNPPVWRKYIKNSQWWEDFYFITYFTYFTNLKYMLKKFLRLRRRYSHHFDKFHENEIFLEPRLCRQWFRFFPNEVIVFLKHFEFKSLRRKVILFLVIRNLWKINFFYFVEIH